MATCIWLCVISVSFILSPCASQGLDSSSGVPCYMQPAGDGCHYQLKPGSESCTTVSERRRLSKNILLVNRTLVSLEQQLIRLGVIPPDNTCSELPRVANGGVVYSDLHLSPGTTGKYVCDTGYALQPLLDRRYEFSCTIDGVWDGDVIDAPVECLLSSGKCDPPIEVFNGTINYTNADPSHIFVGDVILYSCDEGMNLVGPSERYCQRDETWSGPEPECIFVAEVEEVVQEPRSQSGFDKFMVIGFSVASAVVGAVAIIMLVMTVVACYKCTSYFKHKSGNGGSSSSSSSTGTRGGSLEIRYDSGSSEPYRMFRDSSPPPSSSAAAGLSKKKKKKSSSKSLIVESESTAM